MKKRPKNEEEAKNTIYRSLGNYISKNFERVGKRLEPKNEQDRYDYFEEKITKREKEIEFKVSDEVWRTKVKRGCVDIFYGKPPSGEIVEQLLNYVNNNQL